MKALSRRNGSGRSWTPTPSVKSKIRLRPRSPLLFTVHSIFTLRLSASIFGRRMLYSALFLRCDYLLLLAPFVRSPFYHCARLSLCVCRYWHLYRAFFRPDHADGLCVDRFYDRYFICSNGCDTADTVMHSGHLIAFIDQYTY